MQEEFWRGFERRQSQTPYTGEDRRRQAGYPDTGVNAESPESDQDEHELALAHGPDPRIPK